MNYVQIRAFHAVAQKQSFTLAAHDLSLTQPAITVQIKALENICGCDLFYRNGRRAELTEAGKQLFKLTKRVISVADEVDDIIRSIGALKQGHLRIGADGPYHMMELLAEFNREYTDIRVSVRTGNTEDTLSDLLDYKIDVAIVANCKSDPRWVRTRLGIYPLVVIVPKHHSWAGRGSIRLKELDDVPLIWREQGSSTRLLLEQILGKEGVNPKIVLEIGSRETLREAVANGIGISVLQASEVGHDKRLSTINIEGLNSELSEYIVVLKERRANRLIDAFLKLANE